MSSPPENSTDTTSTQDPAWLSLINRSISVWEDGFSLASRTEGKQTLEKCESLDVFLMKVASIDYPFYFFQRRSAFLSQKILKKWSRDDLDDFVLMPGLGRESPPDNVLFVSHFWLSQTHPDPDGESLRIHQQKISSQTYEYIWVDYTCIPQAPRTKEESYYFYRCLRLMPLIIRFATFSHVYPPFEPRLWILYEITEHYYAHSGDVEVTPDIQPFLDHIDEMKKIGVHATIQKHDYRCSFDGDKQFLTSWLELLVLLIQLGLDYKSYWWIVDMFSRLGNMSSIGVGHVKISPYKGELTVHDEMHTFTPFPKWEDGKFC